MQFKKFSAGNTTAKDTGKGTPLWGAMKPTQTKKKKEGLGVYSLFNVEEGINLSATFLFWQSGANHL